MLELARILAGVSLISLILAIAAAISPPGRLQIRQLDGTVAADGRHLQMAAYLLMAAVGVSGIAALMAFSAWVY